MIFLRASISSLLVAYGCCVPMNLRDTPLYAAGDIVGFDPKSDRTAVVDNDLLWPGGRVSYVIDQSAAYLKRDILEGMEEYQRKTCIRFEEAKPGTKDYILIGLWEGCYSELGRVGGIQRMSLGNGCHWKGLVVHELGHALGFYHEQSRSDRDDYLEILWDNIRDEYKKNFIKMNYFEHNLLQEEFDYQSIMLHEEQAFSIDGNMEAFRAKKKGVVIEPIWKKTGLSEGDVRKVNKLYQCFGNVRPDPEEVPDYLCDFTFDDCGFVNKQGLGSKFERKSVTLGDRTGFVMLADGAKGNSHYAQMTTPQLKLYDRPHGCLSFDYFLGGSMARRIEVSSSTDVMKDSDVTEVWRTAYLPVRKSDGDPMFSITAVYSGIAAEAKIAIDNIKLTLKECP